MDWRLIDTAPGELEDVLVWDGERVYLAWRADYEPFRGWHDATQPEHAGLLDPQPTHWMPLPPGP